MLFLQKVKIMNKDYALTAFEVKNAALLLNNKLNKLNCL